MFKYNYYTCKEVALHNKPNNLWVTLYSKVLDLTPLVEEHKDNTLLNPILMFGGKDISHLFDKNTKGIRIHVNPNTNKIDAFVPFGRFLDIPPQEEIEKEYLAKKEDDLLRADAIFEKFIMQTKSQLKSNAEIIKPMPKSCSMMTSKIPWWQDKQYVIGIQSHHSRLIRILNLLTMKAIILEVPCEEKLTTIMQRYKAFNRHASSYCWKYLGSKLDMQDTLDGNGILDLVEKCEKLRLEERDFIPTIHLYYNDDLTEPYY